MENEALVPTLGPIGLNDTRGHESGVPVVKKLRAMLMSSDVLQFSCLRYT